MCNYFEGKWTSGLRLLHMRILRFTLFCITVNWMGITLGISLFVFCFFPFWYQMNWRSLFLECTPALALWQLRWVPAHLLATLNWIKWCIASPNYSLERVIPRSTCYITLALLRNIAWDELSHLPVNSINLELQCHTLAWIPILVRTQDLSFIV